MVKEDTVDASGVWDVLTLRWLTALDGGWLLVAAGVYLVGLVRLWWYGHGILGTLAIVVPPLALIGYAFSKWDDPRRRSPEVLEPARPEPVEPEVLAAE